MKERELNAFVKRNSSFIRIKAYSSGMGDPTATEFLLPLDIGDQELGSTLLQSLSQSRELSMDEYVTIRETLFESYNQDVARLMKLYGYKGKRAFYQGMVSCDVTQVGDMIDLYPMKRCGLGGFEGTPALEALRIEIAASSPAEQIGAALREALSRCIG